MYLTALNIIGIVITLDTGNCGEIYNVDWFQAGLEMSACVALCEVAKTTFLREMGFISDKSETYD